LGYDREGDLLEIFFEDPVPAIGEEVIPGVFVHRAYDDRRVIAVSVMSLTKRFKDLNLLTIPFESTLPEVTLEELEAEWMARPTQRSDQDEASPLRRAMIREKAERDVEPLPVASE